MRTEHHWPAALPRLRWMGEVIEPTTGDVDAISHAAVRLMRGDIIESETPRGERVTVRMQLDGRTTVVIGNTRQDFACAFDALIVAHNAIDNFNVAWPAFEGGSHAAE